MGRIRYKVEWFDDNYPTCYDSKIVYKDVTRAISIGYHEFQKYTTVTHFKVWLISADEIDDEINSKNRTPLYVGYKDPELNMTQSDWHNSAYIIDVQPINEVCTIYRIDTWDFTFIVSAKSAAEALSMIPSTKLGSEINIYNTYKRSNEPWIYDLADIQAEKALK
jgi:hypothetical protein